MNTLNKEWSMYGLTKEETHTHKIENRDEFIEFLKKTICRDIYDTYLFPVICAQFIFVGNEKEKYEQLKIEGKPYLELVNKSIYCTCSEMQIPINGGIVVTRTHATSFDKILMLYDFIIENYYIEPDYKIIFNV